MKKLTMTLMVIAIGGLVLWLAVIYTIRTTPNVATTTEVNLSQNAPKEVPQIDPLSVFPKRTQNAERLKRAQDLIKNEYWREAVNEIVWIPKAAPEYAEAKKLEAVALRHIQAENRELAPKRRESLRDEYLTLMSVGHPHLNYIDAKLTKVKGGYALWATHEYFTQYTFSIGGTGPLVRMWIEKHSKELSDAEIVRVGVMGRGPYASWNYFDVR